MPTGFPTSKIRALGFFEPLQIRAVLWYSRIPRPPAFEFSVPAERNYRSNESDENACFLIRLVSERFSERLLAILVPAPTTSIFLLTPATATSFFRLSCPRIRRTSSDAGPFSRYVRPNVGSTFPTDRLWRGCETIRQEGGVLSPYSKSSVRTAVQTPILRNTSTPHSPRFPSDERESRRQLRNSAQDAKPVSSICAKRAF